MKFLYFTSGVTYRIPLNEDGTTGTPEILKRWTAPFNETKSYKSKKSKPQELLAEIGETVEL